jgi:hypothetical protein
MLMIAALLTVLSPARGSAEGATVTLDEGCQLFDGLGRLVAAEAKVKVVNNAGVKLFTCHGTVMPSPTGETVHYDATSPPPGFEPYCRISGLPTTDWHEVITPSGHATIQCAINGNALDYLHVPPPRDRDSDGLTDDVERDLGTDPRNPDTDGDSFSDWREVNYHETDPLDPASHPPIDTDGDGLFDDDEESVFGTDPALFDTDGDGYGDGDEVQQGSDPLDPASTTADSDSDGLFDHQEREIGTDPALFDTDGDDYGDGEEFYLGSDPLDPNSFPTLDSDGDGLSDDEEGALGTNPFHWDTDGDGYTDGQEVAAGSDPLDLTSFPVEP